ncbi:MAG TPA: HhH-GPD-type base excision DNA repair protein [Acidimicrobiia bacterium]|jgi:uncharacterized HhH-GPD family protein
MSEIKTPFTGNEDADRLLSANPLALMIGMLLDQQVTMEFAFGVPLVLEQRLVEIDVLLDATAIAALSDAQVDEIFRLRPALHRFPGSMGQRTHALCGYLVEHHDGRAEAVWEGVTDGAELLRRVEALPGFGTAKARIFVGVLGKRLGVRPKGWEHAAADWASIADVDTFARIGEIRDAKRAAKAQKKTVTKARP